MQKAITVESSDIQTSPPGIHDTEQNVRGQPTAAELDHITNLEEYLQAILHSWLRTLTFLGITLVPAFFILDWLIIPPEARHMLPLFGLMRGVTTALIVVQYLVIRHSKPSKYSFLHGYFFMLLVGMVIVLMTVKLGGFNAPYYAGLNLVIIAVNMLLPWHGGHSIANGLFMVGAYVLLNAVWGGSFEANLLANNLFFLSSTVAIAASINHLKYILVKREFGARQDLQAARDALWGEMEIAKHIQTALLPHLDSINGFEVATVMVPADSVGGDYYDVFEVDGTVWTIVGDVSGHGVESGLIMMMMQTTVRALTRDEPTLSPSLLLARANRILTENIRRLGADRYMTVTAMRIDGNRVTFAGKHQDILVHRRDEDRVEVVPTTGTWLGVLDDIEPYLDNSSLTLENGDTLLLFTDGVTEAEDYTGEMFGQDRLVDCVARGGWSRADALVGKLMSELSVFQGTRSDDITVVALQKRSRLPGEERDQPLRHELPGPQASS